MRLAKNGDSFLLASVDDVRTFWLMKEVGHAIESEPEPEEYVDALYELRELASAHIKEAA